MNKFMVDLDEEESVIPVTSSHVISRFPAPSESVARDRTRGALAANALLALNGREQFPTPHIEASDGYHNRYVAGDELEALVEDRVLSARTLSSYRALVDDLDGLRGAVREYSALEQEPARPLMITNSFATMGFLGGLAITAIPLLASDSLPPGYGPLEAVMAIGTMSMLGGATLGLAGGVVDAGRSAYRRLTDSRPSTVFSRERDALAGAVVAAEEELRGSVDAFASGSRSIDGFGGSFSQYERDLLEKLFWTREEVGALGRAGLPVALEEDVCDHFRSYREQYDGEQVLVRPVPV